MKINISIGNWITIIIALSFVIICWYAAAIKEQEKDDKIDQILTISNQINKQLTSKGT